jgi:hypothetical protein
VASTAFQLYHPWAVTIGSAREAGEPQWSVTKAIGIKPANGGFTTSD